MAKIRPQRRRTSGTKKTHRTKVVVGELTHEQKRRLARRGEGDSLKESTRWSRT